MTKPYSGLRPPSFSEPPPFGSLFSGIPQLGNQDLGGFDGTAFLQEKIAEVRTRIGKSKAFLETLQDSLVALDRPTKS